MNDSLKGTIAFAGAIALAVLAFLGLCWRQDKSKQAAQELSPDPLAHPAVGLSINGGMAYRVGDSKMGIDIMTGQMVVMP